MEDHPFVFSPDQVTGQVFVIGIPFNYFISIYGCKDNLPRDKTFGHAHVDVIGPENTLASDARLDDIKDVLFFPVGLHDFGGKSILVARVHLHAIFGRFSITQSST